MRYLIFLIIAIVIIPDSICLAKEDMLQNAWGCYLRGDYNKAVDICRVISKNSLLGEEGRYIMGLAFLKLGDYEKARKNFEFVLDNYTKTKRAEELILGVADSYYLEGRFDKAEQYYVRLLKNFPQTDYASIAYLRLGECQRKLGKWQEAESSFYKVTRDFPLSMEAERARDHLKERASFFSIQVGAFSKEDNAENLANTLRKKGYNAYVEKTYREDSLIYRVKVGKFDSKREAQEEAARLRKEGFTVRIVT